MGSISGSIIADGIIKIDTNRKKIQHLEGGIVKDILIKEGSYVNKNQPLLIIEDTGTSSAMNILLNKINASKAKEARLKAQRNQLSEIVFPQELLNDSDYKTKQLITSEIELFLSKQKNLEDQVHLLHYEIDQTEEQIEGLKNEIKAIKTNISYIQKQLDARTELVKKGYTGKNDVWEMESLSAEKKERLGAAQAEVSVAKGKITELQLRIITLENTYRQEADDQLKETAKELAEFQELLRPAKNAQDRTIIAAPLAGQVINLKISTLGGVITPSETLMEIVPTSNNLIVEVKIKTSDIDNVHIGQQTNIQLLAYNRRTTPLLDGKLIYLSGDVIEDTVEPGNFYYLSHIEVNKQSLNQLEENIELFPGMPITAFVQTRERTFIDFILEPIVDNMRRTFREN